MRSNLHIKFSPFLIFKYMVYFKVVLGMYLEQLDILNVKFAIFLKVY